MKNRRKLIALFIMALVSIMMFSAGCTTAKKQSSTVSYSSLSDLEHSKIGVLTGSVQAIQAQERFPDAEFFYYDNRSDVVSALRSKKIDAFADSDAILMYMMAENPDITYIPEKLTQGMKAGAIFSKTKKGKALCDEYSKFLLKLKEDGTYDKILDKWFGGDTSKQTVIDPDTLSGKNGTLNVAVDSTMVPFIFIKDEKLVGLDVDFITMFCKEKGYALKMDSMTFAGILPAVSSGKADLACGGIAYTAERAESVYFAEPTFEGGSVLAILNTNASSPALTLQELKEPGRKIAVLTGSDLYDSAIKYFPDAECLSYDTFADEFNTLNTGKADAAFAYTDMVATIPTTYPNITSLPEPIATFNYSFATQKNDAGEKLANEMSEHFAKLKDSGKFKELRDKWDNSNGKNVMENYTFDGKNGKLKVATTGVFENNSFYIGDELTGMFIELINSYCAEYGYIPEFETMPFASEIAGLNAGTYDIIADYVTQTPDRLESANLTEPFYSSSIYAFVQVADKKDSGNFFTSLKQSFIKNFVREGRWKMIISGLLTTLALSALAGLIGTGLGALICFLRMRKNKVAVVISDIYIRIFRGIPIVVLLLVLNYVIFTEADFPAFWVCVIGFALDFSAYTSEMFRNGIEAVPKGQARAAKAMGFSNFHGFRKVVFPQALIHIIPVYTGQFIALVKLTSVAGYISVMDLTRAADIIRSRTYEAFFPLILTAVIYFILSVILIALLNRLEKKIKPGSRRIGELKKLMDKYNSGKIKATNTSVVLSDTGEKRVLYKISHLMKRYENVTPIKDISCEIKTGDVIAIIGPSGTGKSTFLNMLNQLETTDGGEILFKGDSILKHGYDLKALRRQVGMVFQSFFLFSHLTIVENIMLAQIELLGRSKEDALVHSMEVLNKVGLAEKAMNYPSELSGGQQQRVAIARQVAMDPEMILFDEPTSALDPTTIEEVLAVIRNLAKNGKTMVIVTHEMNFARDVSNRVFYLDEGTIYEEGTPKQIFNAPEKEKTRLFIKRLKAITIPIKGTHFDFGGAISQIEAFGHRQVLEHAITRRMISITEELGLEIFQEHFGKNTDAFLTFEYEETTGKIILKAEYIGEEMNIREEGDSISIAMIQNILQNIEYKYENGKGIIEGVVRSN